MKSGPNHNARSLQVLKVIQVSYLLHHPALLLRRLTALSEVRDIGADVPTGRKNRARIVVSETALREKGQELILSRRGQLRWRHRLRLRLVVIARTHEHPDQQTHNKNHDPSPTQNDVEPRPTRLRIRLVDQRTSPSLACIKSKSNAHREARFLRYALTPSELTPDTYLTNPGGYPQASSLPPPRGRAQNRAEGSKLSG